MRACVIAEKAAVAEAGTKHRKTCQAIYSRSVAITSCGLETPQKRNFWKTPRVKLSDEQIHFYRRATVNPWTQMLKGKMNNWFEVDRQGLAQILERKGKEFALFELIQNGWDEPSVCKVTVSLEHQGRNKAMLVVEDDAP